MHEELIEKLRCCVDQIRCADCRYSIGCEGEEMIMSQAADAIEELSNAGSIYGKAWTLGYDAGRDENKPRWTPVTERLPECEWGAEVGNIEWISCGMVFAGCFGRGCKYRDAYFRTWTDGTEGIDTKDAKDIESAPTIIPASEEGET